MKKNRNWNMLKPIGIGLVLGVLLGIPFVLDQKMDIGQSLITIYFLVGIPMGWTFINEHKPQTIGLVGNWIFWLVWNFLKLCLSSLIGSLLIPYQVWRFYKS